MKPIALLSVDSNPNYLFCVPIAAATWNCVGFQAHVAFVGQSDTRSLGLRLPLLAATTKHVLSQSVDCTMNKALLSQCARLYLPGTMPAPEQYVLLSDADMLIGSRFLHRDFNHINVFGHDLTGYGQIPMCYVGMQTARWRRVMGNTGDIAIDIQRDLRAYCDLSTKERAWFADQAILTARLIQYGHERIQFIARGFAPPKTRTAAGRWDRATGMARPTGEIHDVHLMREPYLSDNTEKIIAICSILHPFQDWKWIRSY